jgi:YHS domain-containing protein
MERVHEHTQEHAPAAPQMNQLADPVCGMAVRGDSSHRVTHGGIEYRFCSASCLGTLRAEPEHHAHIHGALPWLLLLACPLSDVLIVAGFFLEGEGSAHG